MIGKIISENKIFSKFAAAAAIFILLCIFAGFNADVRNYIGYKLMNKDKLVVKLSLANPQVKAVAAEKSNALLLRIEVRKDTGEPVPKAAVRLSADSGLGSIRLISGRTDENGEALASYIPPSSAELYHIPDSFRIPDSSGKQVHKVNGLTMNIFAEIPGTGKKSSVSFNLVQPPLVFIHGYRSNGNMFDNMKNYLDSKGFSTSIFSYKSENGVIGGAQQLGGCLRNLELEYLAKGVQVNKFNIIAHSMGGLVARYYTTDKNYAVYNNIEKIIFLSVPHRGSPLAHIGAEYFEDVGIRDLIPDSNLFIESFPQMINKGVNNLIQTGNIIGQYDEVVSLESSNLEEWGIKSEVYDVGDNNFTVDNLLNGSISEGQNHKAVLNNTKIFERIVEMLSENMDYPLLRK